MNKFNCEELKLMRMGQNIRLPFRDNIEKFVVLDINEDDKYIDIMSKLPLCGPTEWKKNISYDTPLEYTNSDIYKSLQALLEEFPKEIQENVIDKKLPKNLQEPDNLINMGKIWIPSILEMFGTNIVYDDGFTLIYSEDNPKIKQYEYFKDPENRNLDQKWWISSTVAFSCSCACYVEPYGEECSFTCANTRLSTPICLRLKLV